jgi:hypothetical protein
VNDPEKLYRLRRYEAHQAKKLDFVDSKSEEISEEFTTSKSSGESTSTDG